MRTQIADLVQENRSAVGRLEKTLFIRRSSRKGAFLMAEQLAFKQVVGQTPTEERHERFVAAAACVVDRTGNELFPRAALPFHEHRGGSLHQTRPRLEPCA